MLSDKETIVVSLAGEITWETTPHLRKRFDHLIAQGHHSVVLNLALVTYIDSSGLAALLSFNRRLRSLNGHLMLIYASDRIMRALCQTRVSELIPTMGSQSLRHDKITAEPAEPPLLVRTLSVPCDATRMTEIRNSVSKLFESFGFSHETVYDLTLALGEALGNAFDHGGGSDDDGSVMVTVSHYDDRVVVEVTDCGCGCSFQEGDDLPEPTETRGRGIRLMLMLVDSVSIVPKQGGRGTSVRLVKMINSGSAASVQAS